MKWYCGKRRETARSRTAAAPANAGIALSNFPEFACRVRRTSVRNVCLGMSKHDIFILYINIDIIIYIILEKYRYLNMHFIQEIYNREIRSFKSFQLLVRFITMLPSYRYLCLIYRIQLSMFHTTRTFPNSGKFVQRSERRHNMINIKSIITFN